MKSGLVAIGASSGGPSALLHILAELPKDFPAAIVIVQHIDQQFSDDMADWLGQHTPWPVRVIEENDKISTGTIWLAGSHAHVVLKTGDHFGYVSEPPDALNHPSIDVFFQSVSRRWKGKAVGVVLTGMGRDGALGLKTLRAKGHHTIAQDAQSSAVYGMPKAAAALDAAVEILPLDRIAAALRRQF